MMHTPKNHVRHILCLSTIALVFSIAQASLADEIPRPAAQLEKFHLPAGFEIQLVAADPDIGQPMNLNFDARGRLWVTSSVEYPYPARGEGVEERPARFGTASDHPPRDHITVISGIGGDGKPKNIQHFAGGLNIPIGVTPIGDGSQAIGYSIPAIYRFADRDDDGESDDRRELYSRFGNVDTHGMSNAYTRWIDGWIYGCHGFSNQSEITDAAGRVTKLRSGNTYRLKEDGSHFQQFTWGQVNPFGLTFDPLGNLYSADCHSKPLYLLLRGAKYPHFGDKPDGLGFGPQMMRHNHGSTGICGPAYYAADHFPAEYQNNLFVCNPVTGRINRDTLKWHGSTPECVEQPDFVTYDGNVFRPVDLQVGPDGALYVADFCNLVIGHYEAPLDHPDRDRNHGRIWRIVYRGRDGEKVRPNALPDLTKLSAEHLIERLGDSNLAVRTLATNYLVDTHGEAAQRLAAKALGEDDRATVRAHCLWILERLGTLDDPTLDKHAEDPDRLVRLHATRILAERDKWSELNTHSARLNLFDGDPFVRRAAADALAQHPAADHVNDLLAKWEQTPDEDTHLIHTIRMALREHLRDEKVVSDLLDREFHKDAAERLVAIAAASDSEVAAPIFLAHADPANIDRAIIQQAATTIAERGDAEQLRSLISVLPKWFANDERGQFLILSAAVDGLQQKGVPIAQQKEIRDSVTRLAPTLLKSITTSKQQWTNHPVPNLPKSASPWGVRERASADGQSDGQFWDSIAGGEQLTGMLRSEPFALPEKLTFWMCGHNGRPNTPDAKLNHVRLLDANTGEELAKAYPPRNDTAQKLEWALPKHVGQPVIIEIADAHQGAAYAWIGVGRFDPPVVRVPTEQREDVNVRLLQLVGDLELKELAPPLRAIVLDDQYAIDLREAALNSLASWLSRDDAFVLAKQLLTDVATPDTLRGDAAELLATGDAEQSNVLLVDALTQAPAGLQRRIGLLLSQSPQRRGMLLDSISAGKASPRLLQDVQIAAQFEQHAGEADKRRRVDLLNGVPALNAQIEQRIQQQMSLSLQANASPDRGQALFKKHCTNCHRIGEEGGLIGPQLDGVGHRGVARILEDILDPNRNVDVAFRTVNLELESGKIVSGIERRREGQVVVIADQEGNELRINAADIAGRRPSSLSLMPSNFNDTLQAGELNDLMAWLLKQQANQQGTTSPTP